MWILIILLLASPVFAAQVEIDPVAEVAADFAEPQKPRPAGETILPSFPIEKWEQPKIALDVALATLQADPGLIITTVFEISKDGVNFAPVASVTSRGGIANQVKGRPPAPPGFRLSRNAIPDGWKGRIGVTPNKPLVYGAEAGPSKK